MREEKETMMPAPYDWHDAAIYSAPEGETVIVHELAPGWAKRTKYGWFALDAAGNPSVLMWTPKFWRRQYIPPIPA